MAVCKYGELGLIHCVFLSSSGIRICTNGTSLTMTLLVTWQVCYRLRSLLQKVGQCSDIYTWITTNPSTSLLSTSTPIARGAVV